MSIENKLNKFENSQKREKFQIKNKRVKLTKRKEFSQKTKDGLVIATIGSINLVKDSTSTLWECQVTGKLRTRYDDSTLVAVGDKIQFSDSEEISSNSNLPKGIIHSIGKRKTKLSRKSPKNNNMEHVIASNSDYLLIYMSAEEPKYNKRLIDRYLTAANLGDLKTALCINKIELAGDPQEVYDDLFTYYEELEIPVFLISLYDKLNTTEIRDFLKDKTTIITGPSGVGKSSLINYLFDEKMQEIGEISAKTAKGLHTTSFVRMFESENLKLIDTPGIREFALWDITKDELASYFDDFLDLNNDCKFLPCTHTHEPHCAIKKAVDDGEIDPERYHSYLNILESLD